ncbi:MAG TPA: ATP-binding protein [Thermoleophilaceae bacterium]
MPRPAAAFVVAGCMLGVAAELSAYLPESPDLAAGDFSVGLAFLGSGAFAWRRSSAVGALMVATGVAWFLGSLVGVLVFLHRGPLVHLLLGYPRGRLESRLQRVVVGAGYVDAILYPVARSDIVTLVLLAAVLAACLVRQTRAGGAERRALTAPLVAATGIAVVLTAGTVARASGFGAGGAALWAYEVVLALVAVGLCADLRWGRWTQAAITGLVVDMGDLEREATMQTRLARSVGDPSLELGFWVPARRGYVDETDRMLESSPAPSGRALLSIDDETGEPAACIVHDPAVLGEPMLAEAVTAALRVAVANLQLQEQVRTKVEEVAASRRRLVEAADAERRRLERELREGAGPQLELVSELLASCGPGFDELSGELDAVRAELSELAIGIHPRTLTEFGLAAALTELAERSPFAVELSTDEEPLPGPVAAAAYFVCSEGLANAAKHSGASRVQLTARRIDRTVLVEVADDGLGGADPAAGAGLSGLADRVEALGGDLRVESTPGSGTRLIAHLPVASLAGTSEFVAVGNP